MGRVKTQLAKRVSRQLVKQHRSEFKDNFNDNKALISQFTNVKSKKIRNVIAGYVTRIVNSKQD
ncbi:30S ribosomal protein S17e [Candidatus Woesearchaeota archaeon]|nr:30S ribosomal protein S17e [Candidatus Woesearchaeota archaeon]